MSKVVETVDVVWTSIEEANPPIHEWLFVKYKHICNYKQDGEVSISPGFWTGVRAIHLCIGMGGHVGQEWLPDGAFIDGEDLEGNYGPTCFDACVYAGEQHGMYITEWALMPLV